MTPLTSPQAYVEELSATGILSIPAADIVMYAVVIILVIGLIWLSNRHIRTSRGRMNESEQILETERDILERRIAERTTALMRAEEQRMIELRRNAEFGKLSQGLFHDLISPLSSVSLYAQELGAHAQYSEKTREAIRVVTESSRRMNSFMESVRRALSPDAGYIDDTHLVQADVHKELEIVKDILGYKARMAGVEIAVREKEKVLLPIHPVRLHQLILNLVSNAIDACSADMSAGNSSVKQKYVVTISVATKEVRGKPLIELSVSDNGNGISLEDQARMFQTQFTTKDGGTGIGLMTIKAIVEQDLRGEIRVESTLYEGSTFIVGIPID